MGGEKDDNAANVAKSEAENLREIAEEAEKIRQESIPMLK